MKVVITNEQLKLIRENAPKDFTCEKCDLSWEIKKEDKHPYMCHMCGYDSKKKELNIKELESFWKNYKKEEVTEKWSEKYKRSIDCSHPKGFSQRAHCQGRKKKHLKESETKDDLKSNGYDLEKIQKALKILTKISDTFGDYTPLTFTLYGYELKKSTNPILVLFIDTYHKDEHYFPTSNIYHEIGQQLLDLFRMLGIRDEKYMKPMYDFKFNKRPLYDITLL